MTIDTTTLKQSINLLALVSQTVQLRKVATDEFEGPCPHCGGKDRLHVHGGLWMCRKCHPKWSDVIEWARWLHGTGFRQAVTLLGGDSATERAPARLSTHMTTPPALPPQKPQTESWRAEAKRFCAQTAAALAGGAGVDYLLRRGIGEETWRTYGLGYTETPWRVCPEYMQPAIVMPWLLAGSVVGIRYRFLESVDGEKVRSAGGSSFSGKLFGGQALWVNTETSDNVLQARRLILVEGEINAMSLGQVTRDLRCDILSIGSESQTLTQTQVDFARRYGARIVWVDKPSKRAELMSLIHAGTGIASQTTDDKGAAKMDANDLLRDGTLDAVVVKLLRKATPEKGQESLHWDLKDAAMLELA